MSKIKVTNFEMVNALNTLEQLAGTKLQVKISYAVKKNIEILSRELKTYEDERSELINKYGDKDIEGKVKIKNNMYQLKDVQSFNRDIKELQEIENEVNLYNISLDDLLNSKAELTTGELTSIEILLK